MNLFIFCVLVDGHIVYGLLKAADGAEAKREQGFKIAMFLRWN